MEPSYAGDFAYLREGPGYDAGSVLRNAEDVTATVTDAIAQGLHRHPLVSRR